MPRLRIARAMLAYGVRLRVDKCRWLPICGLAQPRVVWLAQLCTYFVVVKELWLIPTVLWSSLVGVFVPNDDVMVFGLLLKRH